MTCDTLTRISQLLPSERADHIASLLRKAGIRPTLQRLMIGRLLFDGTPRHFSAEDLHQDIVDARVPVSLATVYNTLNQFLDVGLIRVLQVDTDKRLFDTNVSAHAHFYDVESGQVCDAHLPQDALLSLLNLPHDNIEILDAEVIIRVRGL